MPSLPAIVVTFPDAMFTRRIAWFRESHCRVLQHHGLKVAATRKIRQKRTTRTASPKTAIPCTLLNLAFERIPVCERETSICLLRRLARIKRGGAPLHPAIKSAMAEDTLTILKTRNATSRKSGYHGRRDNHETNTKNIRLHDAAVHSK